jgi:alpha-N-arabinofuranosidase
MFSSPTVSFKRAAPNIPQGGQAQLTPQQRAQLQAAQQNLNGTMWGLQGSASVNGKTLTLTVVNPHATEIRETAIAVRGGKVASGKATTLTASDIHTYNSFEKPQGLVPANGTVQVQSGSLVYRFPAASVTRLTLMLE